MKNIEKAFITKIVIVVLSVIALSLSAAIILKGQTNFSKSLTLKNNNSSSNRAVIVDPKLTQDEQKLFYSPNKDATEEQIKEFQYLVSKYATPGDTVIIKDCTSSPIVLKIQYGSFFTVNNKGTTDIHFGFNDERTLVKAGSSQKIKLDFKNGPGLYGYGCDDLTVKRPIGVLLLTE